MIIFRDFEIGRIITRDAGCIFADCIFAEYVTDIINHYLRKNGEVKFCLYDKDPCGADSGYFNNSEELSNALSIFYKEPIKIFIPVTQKIII